MAKGQNEDAKSTKKGGDYGSKRASDMESMVKDLKKLPLSTYREDLERTPFKAIFLAIIENKVSLDKTIKFEEDLSKILSRYDSVAKSFNIGGFQKSISREDVKSIFGVVDGGVHIKPQEKTFNKTPFYYRCFQDREEKLKEKKNEKRREYKLTRRIILTKLVGIENLVEQNHRFEDFARLATLFVLSACLAPTSSQSLMWKCTEHVDNLSAICSLDWSRYILETLTTSIGQGDNKAFGGCLMLLPYWLCEKFNIMNIMRPDAPDAYPSFLKWDLQQLHIAMQENMALFENSRVLESEKVTVEALLNLPQGSDPREYIAYENQEDQPTTHDETTEQNIHPTLRLDTSSGERAHLSTNIQSATLELHTLPGESAHLPTNGHNNIQSPLNTIETTEYEKTKGEVEISEKRRDELNSDAIIEDLKEKLKQSEEANDGLKSEADKSKAKIEELKEKLKTSEEANHRIRGELGKSERRRHELESYVRGLVEEGQKRLKEGEEDMDQPAVLRLASLSEITRENVGNNDTRELRANMGGIGKRQKECENEQPSKRVCQGNI